MKKIILFLILIIFIIGCAQEKEADVQEKEEPGIQYKKAVCGNNICEKGETIKNCPEDCVDLSVSWESMNGPPGGRVKHLIQNPSPPYELYAVTHIGIHKSEDKGESWQLIKSSQDLATYNDLTSDKFDLKKIFPSESELKDLKFPPKDIGFDYYIKPQNIVTLGNRILANIILHVDGSGEFTNGGLYISEDIGKSWSRVNLGLPDGVIISNIIQNPNFFSVIIQ